MDKLIFEYDDYRDFLKDALKSRKSKDAKWSVAYFARLFERTPSFVKKIFSKKTHLGIDSISTVCNALSIEGAEREYFYFTVLAAVIEDSDVRSRLNYIRSGVRSRARTGIYEEFNEQEEKLSVELENTTSDYLVDTALELSRILGRPPQENELKENLNPNLPGLNQFAKRATAKAQSLVSARSGGAIHQHRAAPLSGISIEAMRSMQSKAFLSGQIVAKITDFTPHSVFTMIKALSKGDANTCLDLMRECRKKFVELPQTGTPEVLMAFHIQGFTLSRK